MLVCQSRPVVPGNLLTLCEGSAGQTIDASADTRRPAYPDANGVHYDAVRGRGRSPVYKRTIKAPVEGPTAPASTQTAMRDNPAMSFVMLTQSQLAPAASAGTNASQRKATNGMKEPETSNHSDRASISRQVESANQLFEVLSARSDIDHPICAECTELLLTAMEARLTATTKERDAYVKFVKSLHDLFYAKRDNFWFLVLLMMSNEVL